MATPNTPRRGKGRTLLFGAVVTLVYGAILLGPFVLPSLLMGGEIRPATAPVWKTILKPQGGASWLAWSGDGRYLTASFSPYSPLGAYARRVRIDDGSEQNVALTPGHKWGGVATIWHRATLSPDGSWAYIGTTRRLSPLLRRFTPGLPGAPPRSNEMYRHDEKVVSVPGGRVLWRRSWTDRQMEAGTAIFLRSSSNGCVLARWGSRSVSVPFIGPTAPSPPSACEPLLGTNVQGWTIKSCRVEELAPGRAPRVMRDSHRYRVWRQRHENLGAPAWTSSGLGWSIFDSDGSGARFNEGNGEGSSGSVLVLRERWSADLKRLRVLPGPSLQKSVSSGEEEASATATQWRSLSISPDSRLACAVLGEDGDEGWRESLHLWDFRTGRPLWRAENITVSPLRASFSPDSRFVALHGYDRSWDSNPLWPRGRVVVFETGRGRVVLDPQEATPAQQREAAREVLLARLKWMRTQDYRPEFDRPSAGDEGRAVRVAWSPDSRRLAVAYVSGAVKIWAVPARPSPQS